MLYNEKMHPSKIAIDRPSLKCLNFMNKYFGLNKYFPQNNSYVIFDDYFDKQLI